VSRAARALVVSSNIDAAGRGDTVDAAAAAGGGGGGDCAAVTVSA
jgi:hypothetical protein